MTMPSHPRRSSARVAAWIGLAVGPVAGALVPSASAATLIWTGGGTTNNWSDAANWGGVVPTPGVDDLVFAGSTRLNNTNDFAAGSVFKSITFASGAGAFSLGGNAIHLGVGASGTGITSNGDINNNSSNAQTIGLTGLTLDPGKHQITTNTANLNLAAPITRSVGAVATFTTAGGNFDVTGSGLATSNGILGGWAVFGNSYATLSGNNVVALTTFTDIAGNGTLPNTGSANVRITNTGAQTTAALPANPTSINTLLLNNTSLGNETITVGATGKIVLTSGGGLFNATNFNTSRNLLVGAATATGGVLTAGDGTNPADISFIDPHFTGNVGGNFTVNSAISNNASSAVSVTYAGGYYTIANTANAYTGPTYVVSGRISQPTANTFGGATGGPVYIFPGAMVNPGVPIANEFYLSGNGTQENNGMGALRMFGTGRLTGTIHLVDFASVSADNTTTGNVGFAGKITGPGSISFGSPVSTAANGGGTMTIGNPSGAGLANDYAGDTLINATLGGTTNAILKVVTPQTTGQNDNIMPHGLTGSYAGGPTGNLILNAQAGTRTAQFDLNGSNQTINGLSSTPFSSANNIVTTTSGSSTLTIGDSNANGSFTGTITGSVGITKIGSGTQIFTGSSTNTVDTNINAGTLIVNGALNTGTNVNLNTATASTALAGSGTVGNVTLGPTGANKATLMPGPSASAGAVGTLTTSSLTVNGGDLKFDLATPTTSDGINSTGAVNFTAASNIVPTGGVMGGTFTVVSASSSITYGVAPTLVQPAADPNVRPTTYALDTTTDPTKLLVTIASGGAKSLTWTGSAGAAWNINGAQNFNDGTNNDVYFNNDIVSFGAATNRTVTISGSVTPANVTVDTSSGDYLIGGGPIAGAGIFTKNGVGTLTISGDNTYSGTTTISGGTVRVGNTGASGSLGTGGVVNNASLVFARTDAVTVSNTISGSGSVQIGEAGVTNANVTLAGVSSYTGATTVSQGSTLTVAASGGIPSSSGVTLGGSTIVVNSLVSARNFGGGLTVGATGGTVQYGSFAPAGFGAATNLTAGGPLTVDIHDSSIQSRNVYVDGGALTGSGSLTITNSLAGTPGTFRDALATFQLTANSNAFTGNITVTGGVRLQSTSNNTNALGTGNITVNSGSQIYFSGNAAAVSYANNFNLIGTGSLANLSGDATGPGAMRVSDRQTFNGTFTLSGDTLITGNISANPSTSFAGQITGAGALTLAAGNFVLNNQSANASNYGPTAPGSVATIIGNVASRAATVTVANANSIAPGGMQFQGGTLALQTNLAVGNLSSTTAGGTINSSGTATVFTFGSDNSNQTYSGAIADGTGNTSILKAGTGTQVFTGTHTYTGTTTVTGGRLAITNTLKTSPTLTVSGGTFQIAAGSGAALVVTDASAVTGSGKIDLTDQKMIVTNGGANVATYNALVSFAAASPGAGQNPTFTGTTGITTSAPLADGNGKASWIGVAANSINNAGAGLTSFHGQPVGPNDLLVGYTFAGDANMDGAVNFSDFLLLQNNYNGSTKLWQDGDFNYDGSVNFSDFLILQNNYNQSGATDVAGFTPAQQKQIMSQFAVNAVPEPATLGLIGLAGVGVARRRRG